MRKQHIIFLFLFILGCAQSESSVSTVPTPNHLSPNSLSENVNRSDNVELDYDLKRADNILLSPIRPPVQSKHISIDKSGLNRMIDYLKSSTIANDRAQILSSFALELRLGYDWKTDPKSTKPYLKGGKQDLIGKLLYVLTLRYNQFEARNAMIEIMEKHDLLLETIHYFTSEPILSAEKLTDLKKAIEEKNVSDIKELLDDIYVNFYHFFGKYYHLNSVWEEVKKEDGTTLSQPKENGFPKQTLPLLIKGGFIPIDYEPFLNIIANIEITASDEQGNLEIKKTLIKSPMRKFIVDLLASLVNKYYEIEISRPTP